MAPVSSEIGLGGAFRIDVRSIRVPFTLPVISSGAPRVPINANVGYATVTLYLLEMLTMATRVRGHAGSGTRSTFGNSSVYSGRSGNFGWHGASTANKGPKTKSTPFVAVPSAWKGCSNTLWNKINSFKTLYNQTKGPAKYGRPSTTTLNTFTNWINKGAIIQTVSCAQVARWSKFTKKSFNSRTPTPMACKTVLCAKFGKSSIKAVARTKSGSFMVVTSPMAKGRPFCFPTT